MIIAISWPSGIQSQSSGVRGVVQDRSNREPLASASVRIGVEGVIADYNGHFSMILSPGSHTLEVTYVGYQKKTIELAITPGNWSEVVVSLELSDNLLQTAVISDSRYSKALSESSISMEVIKSSLIEHLNATSVDEVLDKVPGVSMVGDQANIRGGAGYSYGAGSRVLLMINDLPALQADAGFPNWDDIPVENIEQIEVIKGAASATYGSSALNGLIHVRTRYAKSDPITKASIFYNPVLPPRDPAQRWWRASPFTSGISFSHARKIGKWDIVAGAYGFKSKSYNETNQAQYGRLNGSVQYRITDRWLAGMHFNMNKRKSNSFFYWKDGVSSLYRPDSLTKSMSNSFRYHIDPYMTYFDRANNKHALRSRIYIVANHANNNQSNSSTLVYNEYQFQRQFQAENVFASGGLVYNYNTTNSDLFSRIPFRSGTLGVYGQLDKKIKNHTTVTVGWRFENYRLHRPEIFAADTLVGGVRKEQKSLWRFGINSKLVKESYLRASWGEGFRFPTLAEQFILTSFGSTFISPNPKLKSERGWNAEIGIKQGFKLSHHTKGYLDAAIFWSKYRDMMEFVFTGFVKGFQSQNIGNTDIKGFELSGAASSTIGDHHITAMTGYTYIQPLFANFTDEDNRRSSVDYNILKYRSKHLFKIDLEDQLGDWIIGTGLLYTSKMAAIDAIFELVIRGLKQYRETHGGFTLLDFRLARTWHEYTFNLILKNLLNTEYTTRPAIMEAPRNLTLKIDYRFK